MKKISHKILTTLSMVILIITLAFPVNAFATSEAYGTERPKLTATFFNSNDEQVDGNSLEEGTYTVNINLSGVSTLAFFEFTADYTNDITINSATCVADMEGSQYEGSQIKNEDNSFVVLFISENDNYTAVTSGQTMITLNVTVHSAGDFSSYFVVSTDPKTTLIGVDYDNGFDSAYVCSENASDPNLGTTYYPNLTYDMSPNLTATEFDVNGRILIATNPNCTATSGGIIGITVSVDGTNIEATTNENGYYTLPKLEEGTYNLTIHGDTTIDRHVSLVVSADKAVDGVIEVDAVPVCICDYNHDTYITAMDTTTFYGAFRTYSPYMDINADGYITTMDTSIYYGFVGKTITYQDLTL